MYDELYVSKIIKNVSTALSTFSNFIINQAAKIDWEKVSNTISAISASYGSFENPTKNQQTLIDRYTSYGKYGWTIPPDAPIMLTRKATCMARADSYLLKYCKTQQMEHIFSELLKYEKIDKEDVSEAVFCYKKKKYKSCALLTFALIDGLLIKLQKITKGKQRSVKGAKEKIEEFQKTTEEHFFFFLEMKNILSCIEAVYAKAKDFTVKFEFVNRNTLSHGMLDREVEQKDCKKIFLLLYNVLQLLDYYKIQVI